MPRPSRRSRTFRRIFVKVPSGTRLMYKRRKHAKAQCAECGAVLKGVRTGFPRVMSHVPKSQKRAERAYSNLCSKCSRAKIKSNYIQ